MKQAWGLFEALVAASASLHVALVCALPSSQPLPILAPSTVIEMADLPPPPPPPPVPPSKEDPAPAPQVAARANPVAATLRMARAGDEPTAASPAVDVPLDFTSTVLSSADGPGVAIPFAPAAAATTSATRVPSRAHQAGPRCVTAANLSKMPRAPRLDAALEKNYPTEARRSGISGSAVLRVQILPDGRVGAVHRVSETHAGFGEACQRTVKSGEWEPPIDRDGVPVATEITYACRFEVGN